MREYNIVTSIYFERKYKKIIKKQPEIKKMVVNVFKLLMNNPFSISLKTHKVISKKYGAKWASYVSKDIRIIWELDNDKIRVICVIDIGGHSGKRKVYK
jgi:mRNA-degrading endonuclease YafQ of YafQ-DinJ toxin-antitoxin module